MRFLLEFHKHNTLFLQDGPSAVPGTPSWHRVHSLVFPFETYRTFHRNRYRRRHHNLRLSELQEPSKQVQCAFSLHLHRLEALLKEWLCSFWRQSMHDGHDAFVHRSQPRSRYHHSFEMLEQDSVNDHLPSVQRVLASTTTSFRHPTSSKFHCGDPHFRCE